MHIPDGMLSNQVALASGAAGAGAVGYAVAWVKRNVSENRTVLMSVLAGLVFALQMLNFPVAPGVSGHFSGGAVAAILIGPWPAVIVMTTVIAVQALMFADGGVIALGANVINLGIVAPLVGFATWHVAGKKASPARMRLASMAAGWLSVVVAALAVAFELWLSGRVALAPAAIGLGGWHALIGVGEGVITAGIVSYVSRVRPDLLGGRGTSGSRSAAIGLGVAAVAAAGLSWLASSRPDALSAYTRAEGIEAGPVTLGAPFAGYALGSVRDARAAVGLAGIVGVVLTAMLVAAAIGALRRGRAPAHAADLHRHSHAHASTPEHEHPHHHGPEAHEHPHASSFERYTYIVSPVHRLDARAKIVAALFIVSGIVLSPVMTPLEFVLVNLFIAAVCMLARLPISALLKRGMLILPVAIALALYAPFAEGGWSLSWSVITRAWLSALTVLLVSATTRPADLVEGFRALGMPGVFASTLTFLHRFVSVLVSQVMSMRRAVASRAGETVTWRLLGVYGSVGGSLAVRSYERAERIHAAMLSRGFTGELPRAPARAMLGTDRLAIGVAVMAGAALFLY